MHSGKAFDGAPPTPWGRFVADSALEGSGFEPPVPPRRRRRWRESRGRPLSSRETTCDLSSLSVRDLLSATAERPFARAGPMVRIRFPQAKSLCLCKPAHQGARCRRVSGGWCSAVTRARLAGYSRPGSARSKSARRGIDSTMRSIAPRPNPRLNQAAFAAAQQH